MIVTNEVIQLDIKVKDNNVVRYVYSTRTNYYTYEIDLSEIFKDLKAPYGNTIMDECNVIINYMHDKGLIKCNLPRTITLFYQGETYIFFTQGEKGWKEMKSH